MHNNNHVDSEALSKLLSYETIITEEINNSDNEINAKYKTFCDAYTFIFENYPMYLKNESFFSTKRFSKELVKEKKSNQYFTKNPIRLNQNLKTILVVIKRILLSLSDVPTFYLSELNLFNYRRFRYETIDFSKGINLIVGNNGTGKTSILDSIAYLFECYLKPMGFRRTKLEKFIELESTDRKTGEVRISGTFNFNDMIATETISYETFNENPIISENPDSLHVLGEAQKSSIDKNLYFPIIGYHCISKGTNRYEYTRKVDNERLKGYFGCLLGASVKEATKWLIQTDSEQVAKFLNIVNSFLLEMENNERSKSVIWDSNLNQLYYSEPGFKITIDKLSSGYTQLIHLIVDLAFRSIALNPLMESPQSISGIVMIDEIDLHLHPKWQWKVLLALRKTFPAIQFIVTTHSPFILSSTQDYQLIVLSDEVIYRQSAYGKSIADIAQYELESSYIPEDLHQLDRQFDDAWRDGNKEIMEHCLEIIKATYGKDNFIYIKLSTKYNFRFSK